MLRCCVYGDVRSQPNKNVRAVTLPRVQHARPVVRERGVVRRVRARHGARTDTRHRLRQRGQAYKPSGIFPPVAACPASTLYKKHDLGMQLGMQLGMMYDTVSLR